MDFNELIINSEMATSLNNIDTQNDSVPPVATENFEIEESFENILTEIGLATMRG